MYLELHLLQNFAPSNLNRDDTGSPKDCEFGGYRRLRISSQAFKRAIRTRFKDDGLLAPDQLAVRSKRIVNEIAKRLVDQGNDPDMVKAVVINALAGVGLHVSGDDESRTQYLLFLGAEEIDRLASICATHWDELSTMGAATGEGKQRKKAGKAAAPKAVADAVQDALDGGKAADLALFGRMLADLPQRNIDAACQVAHAISTNRAQPDFDFYVAVDDLKPEDTSGADMIGTIEFGSACFYRYSNIDLAQLAENLQHDTALAAATVNAYLRAAISAIPTGKQNSMAAHNPPSFIFVTARERGLWSLANAFVRPVAPARDRDLVEGSIAALDAHWDALRRLYGDDGFRGAWVATLAESDSLIALKPHVVTSVPLLLEQVATTLASDANAWSR